MQGRRKEGPPGHGSEFLADQLTLYSNQGADYAHQITTAPSPRFLDLPLLLFTPYQCIGLQFPMNFPWNFLLTHLHIKEKRYLQIPDKNKKITNMYKRNNPI